MVTERKFIKDNAPPALDDGWWASVLSDEDGHHASPPPRAPQPMAAHKTDARVEPDWSHIRSVYQNDQIVSLVVIGHNRGGLLVDGFGLQGFVPFSHLVETCASQDGNREEVLSRYLGRQLRLKIIECVPEETRVVYSERAAKSESGCRNRLFTALHAGDRVIGEVTNITDFGVFIDLGGVEGLIHISELSWGRVEHPSALLKVGQAVDVLVLDVSSERCRVALSLKRLQPNPWKTLHERYAINDVVPVVISTVVSFGAFARLEEGIEGLIHVSEIDLPAGASVREVLSPGQQVLARILQMEPSHQRLGLSVRLEA